MRAITDSLMLDAGPIVFAFCCMLCRRANRDRVVDHRGDESTGLDSVLDDRGDHLASLLACTLAY